MEPNQLKGGKAALIWRFLRPSVGLFIAALVFSMLNTVFNAITPQIIRLTVDSILGDAPAGLPAWLAGLLGVEGLRNDLSRALLLAAGAVLIASLLGGACSFAMRLNLARGSESFIKTIRDALYRHIQRLPFAWHTANQTGEIIQRCTSDVDVIRDFVCNQMVEVARTSFLMLFYLGVMFSMNVRIALVAAAFLPVVCLSSAFFYSKIAHRFQEADEAEGELTTLVQENLTGVRVVRAFGRERYESDRFQQKNSAYAKLWVELGKVLSLFWASGDLLTCTQVLIVVIAGVVETVNGGATLGEFLAFVSYNISLAWPVRSLGRVLGEMSKASVSIERVRYILDAKEESDPDQPTEPPMNQDIVFDHVSFGYEEQGSTVTDVTFTIPAGSTFAILGGTGSGKSTLMHLLDRLYDLPEGQGAITIGGVDIRSIPRAYLRRNIGMVLQEPFLFSRTIEENIRATRPAADRESVRHAARVACVDEAISEFSSGYDTVVGERGVTLSGGQKQRVAIARMLMQKAPIMVFDDSLSAVDAETDAQIRSALKENEGESTVVLISHRINTLMQADHILVLEDGRVADFGTHEELVSRPGIYREIYDIQMNSDDRRMLEERGGEA